MVRPKLFVQFFVLLFFTKKMFHLLYSSANTRNGNICFVWLRFNWKVSISERFTVWRFFSNPGLKFSQTHFCEKIELYIFKILYTLYQNKSKFFGYFAKFCHTDDAGVPACHWRTEKYDIWEPIRKNRQQGDQMSLHKISQCMLI
jgi:hypothetical protein